MWSFYRRRQCIGQLKVIRIPYFIDDRLYSALFVEFLRAKIEEEALVPPGKGFPPAEFNASTYKARLLGQAGR